MRLGADGHVTNSAHIILNCVHGEAVLARVAGQISNDFVRDHVVAQCFPILRVDQQQAARLRNSNFLDPVDWSISLRGEVNLSAVINYRGGET